MFTRGKGCKHTVFFYSQQAACSAQPQGVLHNLFTVACSRQRHQSFLHNLFTVACSAQPQGVLSPVG